MGSLLTEKKLAEMTDEGAFERLATAILRESSSKYRLLGHPGVNVHGKTVKSPLDGIAFVPGAKPPRMIAVHHTTFARKNLEKKWLHDPATVTSRKRAVPSAPPGDLVKTVSIYLEEKKRTPDLNATLILTTNEEPSEDLIRKVNAAGCAAELEIEIWSRSSLAHFLDYEPTGQWIRRNFFGIEQVRISCELLAELSRHSLDLNRPPDDQPGVWIDRSLDASLAQSTGQTVLFVVAESGLGKSVACYKHLLRYVESGGFGIVLPHGVVASSLSLDQALESALRQLHPSLAPGCGSEARSLASEHRPLLVIIEDVNKSGQSALLLEKIASWGPPRKDEKSISNVRILCPVWPRLVGSLGEESRKRVSSMSIEARGFSPSEGADAVQRRREAAGIAVTRLEAAAISAALGHDPLLIALHDPAVAPDASKAIAQFIDRSLERLAVNRAEFTAGEYRSALRQLGFCMLDCRCIEPEMPAIARWFSTQTDTAKMIRQIAQFGEIIRVAGSASDERLVFRHDRVRDSLLSDALAELMLRNVADNSALAEPYFAEIIGTALASGNIPQEIVSRMPTLNPLAIFCAMRHFGEPRNDIHTAILEVGRRWLQDDARPRRSQVNLEWDAARVLSETEGSYVISLTERFSRPASHWCLWARFRNGDVIAGIELCCSHEPGVRWVGFTELMEYVRERHHASVLLIVDRLLRDPALSDSMRVGALRLAGYMGVQELAGAIELSWSSDTQRSDNLAEYLWAAAECCGNDAARLLDPICDAWAALSDQKPNDHSSSPRDSLAAHNIRWAFHDRLPAAAVTYFIARSNQPELRWPLTYVLDGVDHPDAVEFIVREVADMVARLQGTNHISPFAMMAGEEWRRRQEDRGDPMSQASRERLLGLWRNSDENEFVRKYAFQIWAATSLTGDLQILRSVLTSDSLYNSALRARLIRGDREAIPLLIDKLWGDKNGSWWQLGRFVWSDDLTQALDQELTARGARVERKWDFGDSESADWITYDLVMRLPPSVGEALLVKHWDHLRFSDYFIQTALYVSSKTLRDLAARAIADCPDPRNIFKFVTMHFGFKTHGHPGVTRLAQVESLVPYFDYLDQMAFHDLWEVCNDHGWFDFRRRYIDARLKGDRMDLRFTEESRATRELDECVAEGRVHWVDLWVDRFLKSGTSISHVVSVVRNWLEKQNSITALEVAANVIIHAGRRGDVEVLRAYIGGPTDVAAAIIENALYAVRRRSLV